MAGVQAKLLLVLCVFCTTIKSVNLIHCYQCSGTDSNNPFECNEYLASDVDLLPTDCANIHDAKYCIKQIGRSQGVAIECYQCNSSMTMECGDGLMKLDGGVMKPMSCEHVHNAQYCIKVTGGIATSRYCSSLDIGNYCNYVAQPGDKLEYRTCVYTCSTDGCNSAIPLTIPAALIFSALFVKLAL